MRLTGNRPFVLSLFGARPGSGWRTGGCRDPNNASEASSMADTGTDQGSSSDLRMGSLEVRLAESAAEIDWAQALRYRVF